MCHGETQGKHAANQGTCAMAQFSCATASYRIVRLTIELFLVEYMIQMGNTATAAGLVFLAYSLADVSAALFSLWHPLLWFGSLLRGSCFLIFAVLFMTSGLAGVFYAASVPMMALSGIVCGLGTSTWFIHYQTLTNKAFDLSSLSKLAKMRQMFECLGFLLPSIVLAVITQSDSGFLNITKTSVLVLGGISVALFLVSSTQVIRGSADCKSSTDEKTQSVWEAIKSFVASSVIKYFLLDTVILAMSNLLFVTFSISTERYFGLEPAFLWLAAIAVPIGGAFSAICGMRGWFTHNDDRRVVLNGTLTMSAIFVVMIVLR